MNRWRTTFGILATMLLLAMVIANWLRASNYSVRFQQVQVGMTLEEVRGILGTEGDHIGAGPDFQKARFIDGNDVKWFVHDRFKPVCITITLDQDSKVTSKRMSRIFYPWEAGAF
jgi:hypothetical protein